MLWAVEVLREILKTFYTPLHTKSLSSRKSTDATVCKFRSPEIQPAPLKVSFYVLRPGGTRTRRCRRYRPGKRQTSPPEYRVFTFTFVPFLIHTHFSTHVWI